MNQEALLVFENAHLEQDEAVMASVSMTDQTTGEAKRIGEVQRVSQQIGNETWVSDNGASTHMTFHQEVLRTIGSAGK